MADNKITEQEITNMITEQIKTYNETLDTPVDLSEGRDSVLFGEGGVLASVDFVTLVLDIESAVESLTGHAVTLADERAMSQKHSPFRTVGTLADYIVSLLEG